MKRCFELAKAKKQYKYLRAQEELLGTMASAALAVGNKEAFHAYDKMFWSNSDQIVALEEKYGYLCHMNIIDKILLFFFDT